MATAEPARAAVATRPAGTTAAAELAGLDALELAPPRRRRRSARWAATWPKLAALAIALAAWQLVALSGWKDPWVLPPPAEVLAELWSRLADGSLVRASATTLQRALTGFAAATVIGVAAGSVVARVRVLRVAVGSLITGLQTMPSIVWFPMAIMLFGLNDRAIFFVVVLGAAPAIANGLIGGADLVPPLLVRAGRVLGARGLSLYRHVILPASLPALVGGLKQGWAFAWRSLMAGELLVVIADRPSLGTQLQFARDFSDAQALFATMVVILAIGIVVDAVCFAALERWVRRRWGLGEPDA